MRDYMRSLRLKKMKNLLQKGCSAMAVVCSLCLFMTACAPKPHTAQPLTKHQKRDLAFHLLSMEDVAIIHRGNQYDVLIPTHLLFQPHSTNISPTAAMILSPLYHAIKTFDVQTVRVNGLMTKNPSSDQRLLTRARAGIVGQRLWFNGLNNHVPLVYGGLRGAHLPTSDLTKQLHASLIWVHWRYVVTPRMYN